MSDQYINLEQTVYLHFASNDTSGSGGDGASANAYVRLCGAAASAAPITAGVTVSLLSDAAYPAGAYEVAIAATAANGYAASNVYAVFCTLAVDSQNPTGFIGRFHTSPVKSAPVDIDPSVVTDIQSGLATEPKQDTTLNRLGAWTGTGQNTILGAFQATLRSDGLNPSDIGGTFDATTDSQQAIRDRGDAAWTGGATAEEVADAVWDEPRAGHTTAGTYGEHTGDSAMRGTDGANTTTPPTAAQNADAVWDEPRAGHTTAGTYGQHTGDAAMRGTDGANTTTPAVPGDDMGLTAGAVADVQAGLALQATLNTKASQASVDTVDGNVDAIKVKTDQLGFAKAGEVDANIRSVNSVTVTGDGQLGTEWGPL